MKELTVVDKAMQFALKAHGGMRRKAEHVPYILHPMEAATVVAAVCDDEEIIAAALLHDTIEDAGITVEQIRAEFGDRITKLVLSETENKRKHMPADASWEIRKQETLKGLKNTDDISVKILWLGDKLSNMRSFYRMYVKYGPAMWNQFNQKDPEKQHWYYAEIGDALSELSDKPAWREYMNYVDLVFGKKEK